MSRGQFASHTALAPRKKHLPHVRLIVFRAPVGPPMTLSRRLPVAVGSPSVPGPGSLAPGSHCCVREAPAVGNVFRNVQPGTVPKSLLCGVVRSRLSRRPRTSPPCPRGGQLLGRRGSPSSQCPCRVMRPLVKTERHHFQGLKN